MHTHCALHSARVHMGCKECMCTTKISTLYVIENSRNNRRELFASTYTITQQLYATVRAQLCGESKERRTEEIHQCQCTHVLNMQDPSSTKGKGKESRWCVWVCVKRSHSTFSRAHACNTGADSLCKVIRKRVWLPSSSRR
jgi:hypothetical protein